MTVPPTFRRWARLLWPLAAAAVVGPLLWKLPEWQTAPWRPFLSQNELLLLQNELRQTLVLLLGAAGLLTALVVLWRRVAASERAAAQSLTLAQEGQRLDRYARAVAQLADERLEVRLGAIYALDGAAAEAPSQQGPIVEVLCAWVRDRAAWDPERPQPSRLPLDLQAALTVLGRRSESLAGVDDGPRLDLRGTDLRGADLNGMRLERAILREVHLENASLQAVRLAGADLRGAFLNHADLVEADLRGADLRQAQLEAAYLVEAHLEGADLGGAQMAGAYLGGAQLQGADLGGAQLDGAYLYKAQLDGASLHGARAVSAIGVRKDERERINQSAAELEEPGLAPAAPPPAPAPALKPVSLKSEPPPPRRLEPRKRGAR